MALIKMHIPWALKLNHFPEAVNQLTYNEEWQTPQWNYINLDEIEILDDADGSTNSERNAGTYYRYFKPLRKYVWPDGTKKVYHAPWIINRINSNVWLSETAGEVKVNFTRQFYIGRVGDGKIRVVSRNEENCTVQVTMLNDDCLEHTDISKYQAICTITGLHADDVVLDVIIDQGTNWYTISTTYNVSITKTQLTIPSITAYANNTYTRDSATVKHTFAPTITAISTVGTLPDVVEVSSSSIQSLSVKDLSIKNSKVNYADVSTSSNEDICIETGINEYMVSASSINMYPSKPIYKNT